MADPLKFRPFEFLGAQCRGLIGLIKLLGATARIPLRFEARQCCPYFGKVDPVRTCIGACIFGKLDARIGNDLGRNFRDVGNAIIVFGLANVEGLISDRLRRRFESRQKGARDILDVHDGAPRRTVGLQIDEALGFGPGHEIVQNDVEAMPG